MAPNVNDIGPGVQLEAGVVVNIAGLSTVTEIGVEGETEIGTPPHEIMHLKSVETLTPIAS